jgi:hypothetical protein
VLEAARFGFAAYGYALGLEDIRAFHNAIPELDKVGLTVSVHRVVGAEGELARLASVHTSTPGPFLAYDRTLDTRPGTVEAFADVDAWTRKIEGRAVDDALQLGPDSPMGLSGAGAYHAYGRATGFVNFMGAKMPEWRDLPASIQRAWEHVAARCAAATRTALGIRD